MRWAGSLEGMIRGLSGTTIRETADNDHPHDEWQREVKDLEHGMKQGGKVWNLRPLYLAMGCDNARQRNVSPPALRITFLWILGDRLDHFDPT